MVRDERQTRRAVQGGLLIAALAAFTILTFFLDDVIARFSRRYDIVAIMPDARKLVAGSPVWVGGKEVGVVKRVALLPVVSDTTARVAVTLELPRAARTHVRADSRARLMTVRMMGEPVVDISPGSRAAPQLRAGDTLRMALRPSPEALSRRAVVVKAAFDSVLVEMRVLAPVARARLDDTRRAFAALDRAMNEATTLRADVAASPALALWSDPAFEQALARAQGHAAELPRVLAQLRVRAGQVSELRGALDQLQLRADSISARLTAAVNLTGTGNGSLARFQQDSALFRALRAARTELDSLVADMRRRPLRYVF